MTLAITLLFTLNLFLKLQQTEKFSLAKTQSRKGNR